MAWTKPAFDRTGVNEAARALLTQELSEMQRNKALAIVNNWRSAHGYPLQCIKMNLLRRAKKIDKTAIIAQRLKRLPSIYSKLIRESNMKLSQMQDIGGCRAVVNTIQDVDRLVRVFELARAKNPRGRPTQVNMKDYITTPKPDGYRGVHLVFKYLSKSREYRAYNDQKIEIQIRSKLQHAWATAVEIVDAFTGQALKSGLKLNLGDPEWRRFFVLMASAIARREKRPTVPGSPTGVDELKKELRQLAKKLNVETLLSGLSAGINLGKELGTKYPDTTAYLLQLDLKTSQVTVNAYTKEEMRDANDEYLEIEKENQGNPEILVVLVAVDSLNALRTAYPNYYLDSGAFVKALKEATH